MEEKANLLVSYERDYPHEAYEELVSLLNEIGDNNPKKIPSKVKGLFKIITNLDPKTIAKRLESLCIENPSKIWYTYNWIPIEEWVPSTIEEMSKIVKKLAERIDIEERWRMTVKKRFYKEYHTRELIEILAEFVDSPKVDLTNPQKIIRIEILGKEAGISLLKPEEIFSASKVKDKIFLSKDQ